MSKRTWALLAAGALLASTMVIGPASAQGAPAVPAEPNVTDIPGDANGTNDQQDGATFGDNAGGVNFVAADMLDIWFSSTAETISAHIHTTAPGGGGNWAVNYRVWVNDGCDAFQGTVGGNSNGNAEPTAILRDFCSRDLENLPGEIKVESLEDGTGVTTLTFPLGQWPGIEMGATLVGPYGTTRLANPAAVVPQMDTTPVGTDYVISVGAETPPGDGDGPPSDGEVGEDDPNSGGPKPDQPAKEGCKKKKGKGKKKGCKKGKGPGGTPGSACTPYTPGEMGAEAETLLVNDKHTEEAPLEITIEQEMGMGNDLGLGQYDGTAHTYRNLQIDSKAAEAGLFIRYEFPVYEDHDLYVYYPDGTEAAHVGGFNMTPIGVFDGTGSGGHSEQGAEQIDGLRTADCGGYTIDFSNYLGEGGEYTVTVWLGEIQNDPAAPGGGR